jgi:hypothetical protein
MRKFYLSGMLAAALIAAPAQAGDAAFTPDAATTWSARTMRIANIVNLADPQALGENDFKMACDGLAGEQRKHEYGKEPSWALWSQINICSAFDSWAGKRISSKSPCKSLEKGLKDLDNATAETAPAEVVSAAQAMRASVSAILQSAHSNDSCKR